MFDSELENFKRNISLTSYAAAQGYVRERRESWASCDVMRHSNGDKVFIGVDADDKHHVYYSYRDDADRGSIIDFIKRRKGMSLGAIRKELRPWIGQAPVDVPSFTRLRESKKDRRRVEAFWVAMGDAIDGHPYLERERALPASLLALERFTGRVRIDGRGNAVFPHFDAEGLSGYELKNVGFTGFAPGGIKALWLSHELPTDNQLVLCESAIDCLSHAVLSNNPHARYASVGGGVSPQQPELIRAAAARMPIDSEIVSAMDADEAGVKLTEVVRKAVALTGRLDLKFTVHEPFGYKDFNDQLRAKPQPSFSYRPDVPSVA